MFTPNDFVLLFYVGNMLQAWPFDYSDYSALKPWQVAIVMQQTWSLGISFQTGNICLVILVSDHLL